MRKSTLKNRFFSKELKIKQNAAKIAAEFYMYFDFKLARTLIKLENWCPGQRGPKAYRVPFKLTRQHEYSLFPSPSRNNAI